MFRHSAYRTARPLGMAIRPATATNTRLFHATTANRVVHQVNSVEDFDAAVKEHSKVVIDCFATWCGPCKAIAPYLEKLSEQQDLKDKVHFIKFDVDELPQVTQALGVRAMPTFYFFEGGNKADEMVGANPPQLTQKVQAFAAK